jgi:hypothetical protein
MRSECFAGTGLATVNCFKEELEFILRMSQALNALDNEDLTYHCTIFPDGRLDD